MAIKNPDGSNFKVTNTLQQFDPENTELDLFNDWDKEVIEIGGAPIFYYEVFIQMNTVDELYVEDRGKIWSPHPVCLHCYYDPAPSGNYMTAFGIDAPDEVMFEFNYRDVLKNLGHPPKIGSRLYTPHKRENWVIIQRNLEEYKLWGGLRLQVFAQRFQESLSTGEGRVTQSEPDFKLNDIKEINK